MEDKNRHIDQAFTDHAWKQMHQMLDEAMPVETRPKRRLGWWWFLLGIGLVALSSGIYFFYPQKNIQIEPNKKPAAVAQSTIEEDNPELIEEPNEIHLSTINTDDHKSLVEPVSTVPITQENNIKDTNRPLQKERTIYALKESTLALSSFEKTETSQAAIPPPFSMQNITDLDEPIAKAEELTLLPLIEVPGLEDLPLPGASITTKGNSITKPLKFGLSAFVSGYVSPQSSGGGYGAGALLDFPINKSRFSIGVGLGYTAFIQPLDVVLFASDDEANGGVDPGTVGSEDLIFEDGYFTFNNSGVISEFTSSPNRAFSRNSEDNLTMHYLNLPIELMYRRGRFQATLGAEAAYLLAYNSDFKSGGPLNFSNKNSEQGGFDQEPSFNNLQAIQDTQMKSYDFATTVGFGFDVSPKIGVNLKYRRGFVDLVDGNYDRNDFNRFIQATFRYRIK